MNEDCPFCQLPPERIIAGDDHSVVIRDAYPVSPGHTLIIPRRHVGSFFATSAVERTSLLQLLDLAQQRISVQFQPDGFNIGINDGTAAGQTVLHLHIHLIPRYLGDISDPRGGMRWVLPGQAAYWKE